MTNAFDSLGGLRVVKVGITINGQTWNFQDLDFRIQGQRFFSPTSAFCTIKISNLTRDLRNLLLTTATPVLANFKKPAYLTVDVGRQSYTPFRLFQGTCYTSTVTQPPDIGITFRSLDSSGLASALNPTSFGPLTKLSVLAKFVAENSNPPLNLDFNVTTDIQVANFGSTTNTNDLLYQLAEIGGVSVCVNNGTLIVRDSSGYNKDRGFILSQETGMVGMPQATESGVTAQMLVQPNVQIGDLVQVKSIVNPSVNGSYRVSQIAFDIANRDQPFFYTLTLTTLTTSLQGVVQ